MLHIAIVIPASDLRKEKLLEAYNLAGIASMVAEICMERHGCEYCNIRICYGDEMTWPFYEYISSLESVFHQRFQQDKKIDKISKVICHSLGNVNENIFCNAFPKNWLMQYYFRCKTFVYLHQCNQKLRCEKRRS